MEFFRGIISALFVLLILVGLLVLGFVTGKAWGDPFLVCDPPEGQADLVEWYELDGLAWLTEHYPAQADGSMKVDMVDTPEGVSLTVKARACNVWGCSPYSDPFTFTRRTISGATSAPVLVP